MIAPFDARTQRAITTYLPGSHDDLRTIVHQGWNAIAAHPAIAATNDFLSSVPSDGWHCEQDHRDVAFRHPQCRTLPETARDALRRLQPWRKGPWTFADVRIDAEWQSDQKWTRIAPLLPDLTNQTILDIGSNNGYYAHRLVARGARAVFGLDPVPLYVAQAACAEGLVPDRPVYTLPIGLEHLGLMPRGFSLLLLMGILYHRTDPLDTLRACSNALAPHGRLLLETIIIPGGTSTALFVPGRYAGAKGFYWLPTMSCLLAWLRRANLRVIDQTDAQPTDVDEQRSTDWRSGASLQEGLSEHDATVTVEGHPAPWRIALLCARGG